MMDVTLRFVNDSDSQQDWEIILAENDNSGFSLDPEDAEEIELELELEDVATEFSFLTKVQQNGAPSIASLETRYTANSWAFESKEVPPGECWECDVDGNDVTIRCSSVS